MTEILPFPGSAIEYDPSSLAMYKTTLNWQPGNHLVRLNIAEKLAAVARDPNW
jgi:hypothetical protein